jgi:hypothetical protein
MYTGAYPAQYVREPEVGAKHPWNKEARLQHLIGVTALSNPGLSEVEIAAVVSD